MKLGPAVTAAFQGQLEGMVLKALFQLRDGIGLSRFGRFTIDGQGPGVGINAGRGDAVIPDKQPLGRRNVVVQ